MNNRKKTNIIITAILAVTLVAVMFAYPSLPDIIPTHWGINGEVDGTGPKWMMFVFLGIAMGANLLMLFAEKIDPKEGSYTKFGKVFNIFRIFITALLCGLCLLTIVASFSPDMIDMNKIMYPVMGFMFILLGNYMPKVKHNYTFGIKTPWTLASENVWNKTHRMCGPLWVAGGLVMVAMVFVKKTMLAFSVTFASITMLTIIPMVYSYLEFKKEKENNNEENY